MNVPLLDLKLQYATLRSEIEPKILSLMESQSLILGKEVEQLEQISAEYCKTKHALGVSSGTDALLMALMALNIGPGDQVILPTYSFFATAGVVSRLHAEPVFVDVDPVTFMIEPAFIEKAITEKTKAIIPVHLYGQAADMDAIMKIANAHNIPVIEDCAQAIGTQMADGRAVGSIGLMGCFSFYPTKNLGAFGDAGLITTNDDALFVHLQQMRNHGQIERYKHGFVGGNFRIDALQAAVLNIKFPYLESWHQARRSNAALYVSLFQELGLSQEPGNTEFNDANRILLPGMPNKTEHAPNHHIFNQFVIRVQYRNALRAYLAEHGIGTEVYYPIPFHDQPCFQELPSSGQHFPVSDCAAKDVLALPIFPELTKEQIQYVAKTIADFYADPSNTMNKECLDCNCGKTAKRL